MDGIVSMLGPVPLNIQFYPVILSNAFSLPL